MSENQPGLNAYASSGFPIIVHHDAPYSNYTQSGLYNNYPSAGYSATEGSGGAYGLNQDQNVPRQRQQQQPQQQQQSNARKFLQPASYRTSNNNRNNRGLITSGEALGDVEPIENVPALSPTPRQRDNVSPVRASSRPRSPRSPIKKSHSRNPQYTTVPNYMHPAMPKLGRTLSDAVQDELYTPDLAQPVNQPPSNAARDGLEVRRALNRDSETRNDNRASLPRIFQEAQQQHQQDFSSQRNPSHDSENRDRSPFRHDSPFHPTNSSSYTNSYNVADNRGLHAGNLDPGVSQSRLAMALALREHARKEAEQTVAPKTISPRDSLLEFHEPENQHSHMALFPTLHDGNRVPAAQQDMTNNGSLHGSQDGSDLEDFQSMATSRRGSVANSSVSSHLDVPRFNYIQPSYDGIPATAYYYADPNTLGAALPMGETPYMKEGVNYNTIQRPLDTAANSGTYTCTYSGCGQRFTTSTKLQKHRRESHKKSAPSGNSVSSAAAIASRNAQPGPHRCMRLNPSTGKPCNTVFSRPYDLTRHEDTIHNSTKAKARCEICNDDKTFSRGDALVRHRRVKHNIS